MGKMIARCRRLLGNFNFLKIMNRPLKMREIGI